MANRILNVLLIVVEEALIEMYLAGVPIPRVEDVTEAF